MYKDTGITIKTLNVDGGGANNSFLMQFQADISAVTVQPTKVMEITALGAAYLAGLAAGYWKNKEALKGLRRENHSFLPSISSIARQRLLKDWHKAVAQAIM